MNKGQKVRYVGKSGQIKHGDVGLYVEAHPTLVGKHRAEFNARTLAFSDQDLELVYEQACDLSPVFVAALSDDTRLRIRIHYPKSKEAEIQATFSENGIILPENMRPLDQVKEQWSWSAEVYFSAIKPEDTPEGTKLHTSGLMKNSRRDVALALLKVGFSLTTYTKEENEL